MKDTIYKLLPTVMGFLLAWFLFNPPMWLRDLGPLGYLVMGALALALLLSLAALFILASLPKNPRLTAIEDEIPAEMLEPLGRLERLGFRRAGSLLRVHIAPSAVMIGLVHETEPVYATVFCTGTLPSRMSSDFVSILHGDSGGLTTNNLPEGAALASAPSYFRQVLKGQDLQRQFEEHLKAIAYLRSQGVAVRNVSAETFERDFLSFMRAQHDWVRSTLLVSTLITFWRAATGITPFNGPLEQQKGSTRQIDQVRSGVGAYPRSVTP